MTGRLITIAIILAAGYWYWSGPYQDRENLDYERKLRDNAEKMRLCMHGKNYKLGATGIGGGNAEQSCAEKYNLYLDDGRWYSYDDVRREP